MTCTDTPQPPLTGITVLDFTRVVAGPYLTMTLADLGAEVIKVEACGTGDDARLLHPPSLGGEAPMFFALNRSKKSVAIDIHKPEGQQLCRDLASRADILVENFRADVMTRQGLDYATLAQLNPGLIYCSITGYGHDGPYRLVAGYDPVAQAEGGLMYLNGAPESEPVKAAAAIMDTFTGLHASMAILAALKARQHTGQGQFVDLALYDTTLAVTGFMHQMAVALSDNPPRTGNGALTMSPAGSFACADGPLMLVCGNDRQYRKLCMEVLEQPALLADDRFTTNRDRCANREALTSELTALFQQQPRDYWVERLRKAGVPGGSVRTPLEVLAAPETSERDMVQHVTHPSAGTVPMVGSPLRLSATPVAAPVPPPLLGQHTTEVLHDRLGLSEADIQALHQAVVIQRLETVWSTA